MRRIAMVPVIFLVMSVGLNHAWGVDHNEIGLYLDPDDLTSYSIQMTSGDYLSLYLVLTNPYDEDSGTEIWSLAGFECKVTVPEDDLVLAFTASSLFLNIFSLPEIAGGYSEPQFVVGGQVTLGCFTVYTNAQAGSGYYLGPITNKPSIPGMMAFAWPGDNPTEECPMYPVSGSHDAPVFMVNGQVVPAASETWGGVKALYR